MKRGQQHRHTVTHVFSSPPLQSACLNTSSHPQTWTRPPVGLVESAIAGLFAVPIPHPLRFSPKLSPFSISPTKSSWCGSHLPSQGVATGDSSASSGRMGCCVERADSTASWAPWQVPTDAAFSSAPSRRGRRVVQCAACSIGDRRGATASKRMAWLRASPHGSV